MNVVAGYRLMLCRSFGFVFFNNLSFHSYLISNFDAFCEWFC